MAQRSPNTFSVLVLALALGCETSDGVDDDGKDEAEAGEISTDEGMASASSDTPGETGGDVPRACDEIEADYYALIEASQTCGSAEECRIIEGHCGLEGIGDCWHAVGSDFARQSLDDLVREWGEAPCPTILCACVSEPDVACSAGRCTVI